MDEDNLNKSFNDLFEHNEGWIITKNEKGKIKIANCKDDETNIYNKTRDWVVIDAEKTKMDSFKLPKNDLYKCGRFFIRDLLNSEKRTDHFICKNIPYTFVFICGTIVAAYERHDKYSIMVDDGTSSIKCLINKEIFDSIKDTRKKLEDNELTKLFECNENNALVQATLMTKRSKKCLAELVPTFEELELGDIVKIFGTISEYNSNRYIFIKKIVKEPKETIFHSTYLEDMLQLYSSFYEN